MHKVPTLFDVSQYDRRKTIEQKKFETVNYNVLMEFRESVRPCLLQTQAQLWNIEPSDQLPMLPAILMSGYLTGNLKRKYLDMVKPDQCNRFRLVTKTSCMYVKKLDSTTKRPSNVETRNSALIFANRTESKLDTSTNVFLGYTVTEDYGSITGVYAVCMTDDEVVWTSDLDSLYDSTREIGGVTAPPVLAPATISPRKRNAEQSTKEQKK